MDGCIVMQDIMFQPFHMRIDIFGNVFINKDTEVEGNMNSKMDL